jgi:site-specific DNA recombinase
MISTLRKLGAEPQAIEQPLDLTVSENKMMLAFYLAVPEVENDLRALNVFFGMRRAKEQGRWVAIAPIGYKNRTSENGEKYIAPNLPYSAIIPWCFEKLDTGSYTINDI